MVANPVLLRAALVLVVAGGLFVFGIWVIRVLRRNIAEEANVEIAATPTWKLFRCTSTTPSFSN